MSFKWNAFVVHQRHCHDQEMLFSHNSYLGCEKAGAALSFTLAQDGARGGQGGAMPTQKFRKPPYIFGKFYDSIHLSPPKSFPFLY